MVRMNLFFMAVLFLLATSLILSGCVRTGSMSESRDGRPAAPAEKEITIDMYDEGLQPYFYEMKELAASVATVDGLNSYNEALEPEVGKNIKGLISEERYIPSKNGDHDIRIRIFRPDTSEKLPAMLYLHGGGYMAGVPEIALKGIKAYIKTRPCVVVAPDYRKSLHNPFPAGFNDAYDTLLWMKENAESLNIKASHFMVVGLSAGGGLTAAVTLKACDTGDVAIAFQMPVYPMLDYRQETESAKNMKGAAAWSTESNAFAWKLYLRDVKGAVPVYASPALATNFSHLPPTITFVGELEPFRDETIRYVKELEKANVPVKFKFFEGAFHAFETIAEDAEISKQATRFLLESYADYYDSYVE